MTNSPSIVPPPELVQRWLSEFYDTNTVPGEATLNIAARAATWGADQELEACCLLLDKFPHDGPMLHDARRPKPPSLKEAALKELAWVDKNLKVDFFGHCDAIHTIRRALEALPND